jgi:hypothetical protein
VYHTWRARAVFCATGLEPQSFLSDKPTHARSMGEIVLAAPRTVNHGNDRVCASSASHTEAVGMWRAVVIDMCTRT